jgi:hypothetical protein
MSKNVRYWILSALALASTTLVAADRAAGASASARLILQGTYIDAGYYGSHGLQVPRDRYTAIGNPLVVTCPRSATSCVIEADLFIQSGLSFLTGNQYNLCLFVDGNRAPNCQIVGSTPADASYAVGTTSQQVTGVTPGDHTVQAFFLTYKGTKVFNFTSNYRVYD